MKIYSKTFLFLLALPLSSFALSGKIPIQSHCSVGGMDGYECLQSGASTPFSTETRSGKILVPNGEFQTKAIFQGTAPISIGRLCFDYHASGGWGGIIGMTIHNAFGDTSTFQQVSFDSRVYTPCFANTVYMQKDDYITVKGDNGGGNFGSIIFENVNFLFLDH